MSTSEIVQVPIGLKKTVERVHGEKGQQWLADLPSLLDECRQLWSLELDRPFANLSYNLVIPGRNSQRTEIVLKLGVPCDELLTEASALSLFGGVGAVRLLEYDESRGVLLMERAMPGTSLYERRGGPEATRTAAKLMQRLWREPPEEHSFPSLEVWFDAFKRLRNRYGGDSGPFPPELIARAERTFVELDTSSERIVVLHGDLHHSNILYSECTGWVAIDPKGICGDPGYEVGAFMLNQLPSRASNKALKTLLNRRLSIFSDELQIRRERLARWAFCHAMLSAIWNFEEASEWRSAIHVAQILEKVG